MIKNKNLSLYRKYLHVYLEIIKNLTKELISEINEVNQIEINKENKNRRKDWINDLEKRVRKVSIENELFKKGYI